MRMTKPNLLKVLLHKEAAAMSDEAIRTDEQVPIDQLENFQRLAQIVKINDEIQRQRFQKWPIVAILAGTLLIVSVLLFVRVSETEIELDVHLSQISFESAAQQHLTDVFNVFGIGVSGLQEIRMPHNGTRLSQADTTPETMNAAVHISVGQANTRKGTATLAPLVLSPGTRVQLKPEGHNYQISISGITSLLRLDINGPISIVVAGVAKENLLARSPQPIVLRPGSEIVDVQLTTANSTDLTLSPNLLINHMWLSDIDELVGPSGTMARQLSTILSGTLYFESLRDSKRLLRPGEALRFDIAWGEIRRLIMGKDQIVLKFHGVVRRLQSGSFQQSFSLMPTYLEWIQAQHGLSLFWATTLYLFGLLAGILRWWRT